MEGTGQGTRDNDDDDEGGGETEASLKRKADRLDVRMRNVGDKTMKMINDKSIPVAKRKRLLEACAAVFTPLEKIMNTAIKEGDSSIFSDAMYSMGRALKQQGREKQKTNKIP